MDDLQIRTTTPDDLSDLEDLYPAAFPDEDLLPVVRGLLKEPELVISLAAIKANDLIGHAIFTRCGIEDRPEIVGLLGPVAVSPTHQKQGVGSAMIRNGLERCREAGFAQVHVLGDPAYYSRFGFEALGTVQAPYEPPEEWAEAWRVIAFEDQELTGKLTVPAPWQDSALWSG
ncbi:MAG: N-acetyltransferase [Pseudomonadota bacterium]